MLASLLYLALPWLGWRGMFIVGVIPALLVLYIRRTVPESPDWLARTQHERKAGIWTVLRQHAGLVGFAALVMMAFNFFSHGSQDLYPSQFLGTQHHLSPGEISGITIVANIGAILAGLGFGTLSQRIGRKWAIVIAALLALPVLRLWAFSTTPVMLGLGAFLMQICVQGAWGIVPVYLNELPPATIRGTFPGLVYQLGNFLASANANIQVWLAERFNGDYGMALGLLSASCRLSSPSSWCWGANRRGRAWGRIWPSDSPGGWYRLSEKGDPSRFAERIRFKWRT